MLPRREITNKINWVLDHLVPPFVRDSDLLMRALFKVVFGKQATHFYDFKEQAPFLSQEDYVAHYKQVAEWFAKRETDLNAHCEAALLQNLVGDSVLDAGCGRGYLARKMAENDRLSVTGVDIFIVPGGEEKSNLTFLQGNIEALPFADDQFDSVVCTHTLEHILDIDEVIDELRRVARQRLLVVVPRQREYKYTFDLHVHFFPYASSLQKVMRNPEAEIALLGGDFFYQEDL